MQGELFKRELEVEEEGPDYRFDRNLARAAEFLAAFDISRRGFDCFTVGEGLRYDLIADINGIRRIQVKMNHRAKFKAPGSVTMSYTFGNSDNLRDYVGDIDLFAFVAMDCRLVLYGLPERMKSSALHIPSSRMTDGVCELSWVDATRNWIGD